MAKKTASSYMTSLERILGGVFFAVYLLVLPFASDPLFAGLERLLGRELDGSLRTMISSYILFALTVIIFWNYLGRTTGYFLSSPWRTLGTAAVGLVAFYGLNELCYRAIDLVLEGQQNLNDVAISAQIDDAPRSTFLIVVFLAPFVEEVLFRGYVFGNIRQHSRVAAYVVSCLLFAFTLPPSSFRRALQPLAGRLLPSGPVRVTDSWSVPQTLKEKGKSVAVPLPSNRARPGL